MIVAGEQRPSLNTEPLPRIRVAGMPADSVSAFVSVLLSASDGNALSGKDNSSRRQGATTVPKFDGIGSRGSSVPSSMTSCIPAVTYHR